MVLDEGAPGVVRRRLLYELDAKASLGRPHASDLVFSNKTELLQRLTEVSASDQQVYDEALAVIRSRH